MVCACAHTRRAGCRLGGLEAQACMGGGGAGLHGWRQRGCKLLRLAVVAGEHRDGAVMLPCWLVDQVAEEPLGVAEACVVEHAHAHARALARLERESGPQELL